MPIYKGGHLQFRVQGIVYITLPPLLTHYSTHVNCCCMISAVQHWLLNSKSSP